MSKILKIKCIPDNTYIEMKEVDVQQGKESSIISFGYNLKLEEKIKGKVGKRVECPPIQMQLSQDLSEAASKESIANACTQRCSGRLGRGPLELK